MNVYWCVVHPFWNYSQLPDREKKSVYPKNFSRIPCGLIVCVCVWMAIHRCRWHKTMKLMTFQTVHALPFSFACGCIQHFCALHLFIDASSASHTHTHTHIFASSHIKCVHHFLPLLTASMELSVANL